MKFSRPLCLLLSLTILFSIFVVPSRAATNLVNPNLLQWDNVTTDSSQTGQQLMYVHQEGYPSEPMFLIRPTYLSDTVVNEKPAPIYTGWSIDPVLLRAGDSYTFRLHIPSPEEIRSKTDFTHSDSYFANWLGDVGFQIGFGGITSNGKLEVLSPFITINKDNYLSYAGKDFIHSFECPSYSFGSPGIYIFSYNLWSNSVLFLDDSMQLVNNSAEDEEGFFDNLGDLITGFFHDLKWDLIGGSCGDSDCSKTPHSSLSDRIGTALKGLGDRISGFISSLSSDFDSFISGLGDRISGFFDSLKTKLNTLITGLGDRIWNFFKKLGNLLLYLTWDEVAPDNPFEGIDSPLDNVTSYFDNVIDYLEQIKTDLTNLVDSVSAGIYILDEFTKEFPWIKALCLFSFALILITRIVGI